MPITNAKLSDYPFLQEMYDDEFYPAFLVDKCKAVLVRLCEAIEKQKPDSEEAVLALTHAATEEINELALEFEEHASEIETAAREAIAADFDLIVDAYGFDLDIEDVIATRDW